MYLYIKSVATHTLNSKESNLEEEFHCMELDRLRAPMGFFKMDQRMNEL